MKYSAFLVFLSTACVAKVHEPSPIDLGVCTHEMGWGLQGCDGPYHAIVCHTTGRSEIIPCPNGCFTTTQPSGASWSSCE